jgi:hypothetical protein
MVHVGEGCMALHEHRRVDFDVQLAAQVGHSLRLMLATAIGKKDERDALRLEPGEGLVSARERIRASYEDSVDTDSRQPCAEDRTVCDSYSKANANSGMRFEGAAAVCRARRNGKL